MTRRAHLIRVRPIAATDTRPQRLSLTSGLDHHDRIMQAMGPEWVYESTVEHACAWLTELGYAVISYGTLNQEEYFITVAEFTPLRKASSRD